MCSPLACPDASFSNSVVLPIPLGPCKSKRSFLVKRTFTFLSKNLWFLEMVTESRVIISPPLSSWQMMLKSRIVFSFYWIHRANVLLFGQKSWPVLFCGKYLFLIWHFSCVPVPGGF